MLAITALGVSAAPAAAAPDTTPPTVSITTVPEGPPPADQHGFFNAHNLAPFGNTVRVDVSATDPSGVTNISCTDDTGTPGPPIPVTFAQNGSNPRTGSLTLTEEGFHGMACGATDGAGNTTAPESGASKDVEFDVSPPSVEIKNYSYFNASDNEPVLQDLSDRFQRQHAIAVGWYGSDALDRHHNSALDNFDVQFREAGSGSRTFGGFTERDYQSKSGRVCDGPCTARYGRDTFVEEDGATVCYSTQGIDGARNVSGYSAEVCTAVPLDDRALSRKGRWTRIRKSGYFSGALLKSTRIGSALTSPVVFGEELALLVSTGPNGGKIQTRWHGHNKTISLRSAHTKNRKVVVLHGYTGRGQLLVRVVGRGVSAIDGFGVWKRP